MAQGLLASSGPSLPPAYWNQMPMGQGSATPVAAPASSGRVAQAQAPAPAPALPRRPVPKSQPKEKAAPVTLPAAPRSQNQTQKAREAPEPQVDQVNQFHGLLLHLLDSQITALLPEGAPEVDRGHLMRTLLSVYEQLQILKGVLGEKTALALISLMMNQANIPMVSGGGPAMPSGSDIPPASAERRLRSGSDETNVMPQAAAAAAREQPELLAPTPMSGPVLATPFSGAQQRVLPFDEEANDGKGSPVSRPPTESPGPMSSWIPSGLLEMQETEDA
jgi:hypothetical protein